MSPFRCSLKMNGLCGKPAAEVLLIDHRYSPAEAHFRCADHPAAGFLPLVKTVDPDAECLILEVKNEGT